MTCGVRLRSMPCCVDFIDGLGRWHVHVGAGYVDRAGLSERSPNRSCHVCLALYHTVTCLGSEVQTCLWAWGLLSPLFHPVCRLDSRGKVRLPVCCSKYPCPRLRSRSGERPLPCSEIPLAPGRARRWSVYPSRRLSFDPSFGNPDHARSCKSSISRVQFWGAVRIGPGKRPGLHGARAVGCIMSATPRQAWQAYPSAYQLIAFALLCTESEALLKLLSSDHRRVLLGPV